MKNTYTFTMLLFLIYTGGSAQQKVIDSLEQQVVNPTNGKTKLVNLIDLGYYYAYMNPEKGLLLLDEAVTIAIENKDSLKLASAFAEKALNYKKLGKDSLALAFYDNAGDIYKATGNTRNLAINMFNRSLIYSERSDYKGAVETLKKVVELHAAQKDTMQMGYTMGALGYHYMNLGDYTVSMEIYLKATALLEQINQEESLQYASTQANMGVLYQRIDKPDIALGKYQKALDIYRKNDNQYLVATQHQNIGSIYFDKAEYKKALINFKAGYNIHKKTQNVNGLAGSLGNIGSVYTSLKEYDKAIAYIDSAVIINKELKNYGGLSVNYNNKGLIYLDNNKIIEARNHFNSGLFYAEKVDDKRAIHLIKYGVAKAASKQGDYKTAFTALEESRVIKDSLLSNEKKEELAILKTRYEYDKEKAVMEAEFQKDQAIQQASVNRQVLIRNVSIGSGALLIILLSAGFVLWRKKREATYNAQLSSSQLQSLRAQMNPHFIFNTLNSINDYVLKNEKQTASSYLTQFSIMVRKILENTEEEEISLTEEIFFLKNYVALEQKRLQNNFTFNVLVKQDIDLEVTLLPPSLLQPFIENSIWHGLSSKEDGLLSLSFTKNQDNLICTIEDNGIGLSTNGFKKEASRKSFGLENVKNRLNLLNKSKNTSANLEINNREGGGVRVKVILPLSLKF